MSVPFLALLAVLLLLAFAGALEGKRLINARPPPSSLAAESSRATRPSVFIVTGATGVLGRAIVNDIVRRHLQEEEGKLENELQGSTKSPTDLDDFFTQHPDVDTSKRETEQRVRTRTAQTIVFAGYRDASKLSSCGFAPTSSSAGVEVRSKHRPDSARRRHAPTRC